MRSYNVFRNTCLGKLHAEPLCNLCDGDKIHNLTQRTGCTNVQRLPRLNYLGYSEFAQRVRHMYLDNLRAEKIAYSVPGMIQAKCTIARIPLAAQASRSPSC